MNMLPGSTVSARTTEVEGTLTVMAFPLGSTVPVITIETVEVAVQTADIMKMFSAATVPAVTAHVATNKTHKDGNLLKKPARKRSHAAKGGPKCGTNGGRK